VVNSIFFLSRTVFDLLAIFVYNEIFLSRGQFYRHFRALAPEIVNSEREIHKKARVLTGPRPLGAKNFLSREPSERQAGSRKKKIIKHKKRQESTWVFRPIAEPLLVGLAR